jgi:NAD+ kinase
MPERLRRIGVLTGPGKPEAAAALAQLAAMRREFELELLAPADEAARHPQGLPEGFRVVSEDEFREADLCMVFAGDGAILRALGRLIDGRAPVVGVNFGNVGFLAALPRREWTAELASILAGEHRVIQLLTVDVQVNGRQSTAVNDVILSRVHPRHVLNLQYEVAGVTVGTMFCDGLIIASPTGSTAYNLSCGGPIVEWDAGVLVLNFIAPHSLGFRPVILRPDHVITARNVSPQQEAEIVVDGEPRGRLCCGDEVRIAAGPRRARLMVSGEGSFYQNVEEKLFDRRDAR